MTTPAQLAGQLRFLSLFSGIGGLDLGLERAGMRCVGQVEIDPYCRAVLAKHWPDVSRHDDVRTWEWDGTPIDLVCGGVPCQPASCAGKRKGAEDERWLWGEFLRVVSRVRPAWVLAENVRGFLSLADSARVFDGLEALHYEIGTLVLGAHHIGAPHKRDRVWIVGRLVNAGSTASQRNTRGLPTAQARKRGARQLNGDLSLGPEHASAGGEGGDLAHPAPRGLGTDGQPSGRAGHADERGEVVADAVAGGRSGVGGSWQERITERCESRWPSRPGEPQHEWEAPRLVYTRVFPVAGRTPEQGRRQSRRVAAVGAGVGSDDGRHAGIGEPKPGLGYAVDGLPRRLAGFARRNALKALGNSVCPQVGEVIGRAIVEAHR